MQRKPEKAQMLSTILNAWESTHMHGVWRQERVQEIVLWASPPTEALAEDGRLTGSAVEHNL